MFKTRSVYLYIKIMRTSYLVFLTCITFNLYGQINLKTQSNFNQYHAERTTIATIADTLNVLDVFDGMRLTVQDTDQLWIYNGTQWNLFSGGSGGNNLFDSNRPILRIPEETTIIGGNTVQDFLEWWYFTPPTVTLTHNPQVFLEIGDSARITFTYSVNNPGNAVISNGRIVNNETGDVIANFGSALSGTVQIDYTPLQTPSDTFDLDRYTFTASIDWSFGTESGTDNSSTRVVSAVYPVLFGMTTDTLTTFNNLYSEFSAEKSVTSESNKTALFTGTGLFCFCMPDTWNDNMLSRIEDPNGFNITNSFTRSENVLVTSSGLTNNWIDVSYSCYVLNTGNTVANNVLLTFFR